MELIKAFTLSLGELSEPIITPYQMGLILNTLYKKKVFRGETLGKLQKDNADRSDLNRIVNQLLNEGILDEVHTIKQVSDVYSLLGSKASSDIDVICTIDPFAYLSHLGAMEFHGITDRIPSKLFISTPSPANWKEYAAIRMEKDLGDDFLPYLQGGLPELKKPLLSKIGRVEIGCFNSKHTGAFVNVRGRSLRVSSIGRTFLDMLRNPELSGGINHVLDVFSTSAEKYLPLIVAEIEQHGSAIDKVRAGYILDERLKLNFPERESWVKFAQRGGSRRLDPGAEYHNVFSEKWCLSLNTFERGEL